MIDPTRLLTDALIDRLHASYRTTYGSQEPAVPEIVGWAAELAMETISRTDATYHDTEHTAMVTVAGVEILRGLHLVRGGVTPDDWLHAVLALLCHDIGYVRGVCRRDAPGAWVSGVDETTFDLPHGATDAAMQPWHVDRGIRFVHERFAGNPRLDVARIAACIDYTRFPVPDDRRFHETTTLRALVRAADLIGQLADPSYLRKLPALFAELKETGQDLTLGFANPTELRNDYPAFYDLRVRPWVEEAVGLLRVTSEGRRWVANLYAHVQAAEQLVAGPASTPVTAPPAPSPGSPREPR